MALGVGYLSFMDFNREQAAMSFLTGAVTAVSLPGLLTQFGALRTATAAITLGTIREEALYAFKERLSNVAPTDENAQRERKWLVTYEDNTQFFDPGINAIPNEGWGKLFNIAIPTADLTGNLLPGSEFADLNDGGVIEAWVTAFEAIGRSPYGGTVTVVSMRHVGRNT